MGLDTEPDRLRAVSSAARTQFEPSRVASSRPRRWASLRVLGLVAGLAVLAVAASLGFGTYRNSQLYVSTDNAQLSGTPIQIGAINAGRVASVLATVGSAVRVGEVVAQVALPTQIGVAQSGQPKLAFLGEADSRVDVQSPIDGVVLAVPTAVGASVQAGQPIVTVTDPGQLWVNANIDETSIARVSIGQTATVHLDALGADVPGRVEAITPAAASIFSLLPQANTTGTFSKVTQVVPVRIAVNLGNQPALLGTSVEVKIRVE